MKIWIVIPIHVWIVVDVLSIWMYWYKDLHLLSLLYLFFLVNAVYGLIAWKKEYKRLQVEQMVNKIIKETQVSAENIANALKTPWTKFIEEHQKTYYTTDDPEHPFNKGDIK